MIRFVFECLLDELEVNSSRLVDQLGNISINIKNIKFNLGDVTHVREEEEYL